MGISIPTKARSFFILFIQTNGIANEKQEKARRLLAPNKPKLPEAAWIKGLTCLGKVPSLPG